MKGFVWLRRPSLVPAGLSMALAATTIFSGCASISVEPVPFSLEKTAAASNVKPSAVLTTPEKNGDSNFRIARIAATQEATTENEKLSMKKNKGPETSEAISTTAAASVDSAPTIAVSTDDAKRLAIQHLALRNARWGEPVNVEEEAAQFLIFFETPVQETRLVGPRIVTVRKDSGLAKIKNRR